MTNIALDHFDPDTRCFDKDIVFSDCIERVYVESTIRPSIAKRFSLLLVEGNDKSFRFAQVLLFFHGETQLEETITGECDFRIF